MPRPWPAPDEKKAGPRACRRGMRRPFQGVSMSPRPLARGLPVLVALLVASPSPAAASFVTFESGQVRPLALSPDGTRLFAVDTPDDRLEIFDVSAGGLTHADSVPVGLEPVAVAARTNGEAWVVNTPSDSVSNVYVGTITPTVTRTLIGRFGLRS